ncbi:amidase [Nibribacter ruber]|uniref:Amidase n=1 Tax=Nibribacter ruber TaxID=2698458 RepID=A0A6P1P2Q3_9BACT|nr:amidase [Nibribacter ruber]QHL88652.1 amidase [Nibribacter ruber]
MLKKSLLYSTLGLLLFTTGALFGRQVQMEKITIPMVQNAQKLLGLSFTEAQIDTALAELTDLRNGYVRLRQVKLENSVPPALQFNPIPVGFQFAKEREKFKASSVGKVSVPANKEELAFYSVRELADLLKNKKITSLELTQFFLDRLKRYNPQLHCVTSFTEELALQQARQADSEIKAGKYKGLLHGIPFGVKDLLSTKGYKTTWGSVPYKDQVLEEDATVVTRLREAGAVLVAKMTLGELAMGDVWYGGKTRTPWDVNRGSSGSSAGSASAVAAGLLPFAIGTETLGSIVSPSNACGTTGLRPSYGRVSRHGAMALSWSMDKIGPIARTVEDCAIVFNAIYGPDGKDQTVYDAPFNYNAKQDLKKLRIGYLKSDFERNYPTKAQDQATLEALIKAGYELIPIELPKTPVNDLVMTISVEGAAAFDEITRNNKVAEMVNQDKNAWPNTFRSARFIPAVEYVQAQRVRYQLIQEMHKMMEQVDVYVSPSFASSNLVVTNLTGHPCVVVPNGFNSRNLPTTITFIGKLFGEADLLAFAKAYQDQTDFHKKHPAAFLK